MHAKAESQIILVSPIAPPIGGVTRWTALVQSELKRQRVPHHILNTSPRRRALDGQTRFEQIMGGAQSSIRTTLDLSQKLRKAQRNVVHISSSGGMAHLRDICLALVSKSMGAKIYLHLHHGRLPQVIRKVSLERIFLDVLSKLVDSVIVLDSRSSTVALSRWKSLKVEVIPNPVKIRPFTRQINNPPNKKIIYLGWINPQKGISNLLSSWDKLSVLYPDWSLALIGGISEEFRQTLEVNHPSPRWQILREVAHDEAIKHLQDSAILVLPSYSEGFPNVVLESMSLGKPLVATRVGAIEEMLSEGGGILVSPGAIGELTEALSRLLGDEKLRKQTGEDGYARVVRDYDLPVVVNRYRESWGV